MMALEATRARMRLGVAPMKKPSPITENMNIMKTPRNITCMQGTIGLFALFVFVVNGVHTPKHYASLMTHAQDCSIG